MFYYSISSAGIHTRDYRMINHYVCYIPEIVIRVPKEWVDNFKKTGNPENKEKRIALYSVIKRWVYLSWILQSSEPRNLQDAYGRRWIWDEITHIKSVLIPDIVSPYEVSFITPYFELPTGKLVQFSKDRNPVELDFTGEEHSKVNVD